MPLDRRDHLLVGGLQLLPFVEKACVHRSHGESEPVGDIVELVGLCGFGHRLHEAFVGIGQVAQQHTLGSLKPIFLHVLDEAHAKLVHVPRDRLRPKHVVADPGMTLREQVVGGVEKLRVRLRVLDLLQLSHALVVIHALGLHRCNGAPLERVGLPVENGPRLFERRFDQRENVKRVRRVLRVEHLDRFDHIKRQGLVE